MSKPGRKVVWVRIFFGFALTFGFGAVLFIDFVTESNIATSVVNIGVVTVGLVEFYRMQENRGVTPFPFGGYTAGILLVLAQWVRSHPDLGPHLGFDPVAGVLIVSLLLLAMRALARHRNTGSLDGLAATVLGLVYVWLPLTFLFEMRNLPGLGSRAGVWVVLHLLVTAKIGDVFAFFTGRIIGRTKLAPFISPGKTVEGSAGGLLSSIVFSALLCQGIPELRAVYGLGGGLLFGAIVGLASQAGDLFESLLKRRSRVKDSGQLIPEFGGLLDLIDCLLFAGPVAYFLLLWYK
jgi:phosphatidate cytidylyltransferase